MRRIREVIVVEGRYDKNAVLQVVDATVLETNGFSIFNDKQKTALLRRLADQRGLILLTDSDGAGFLIRNFLKGALPAGKIKQAYIPDMFGKERRKRKAGKEGKLGVEGMRPEVLVQALERAGATFCGEEAERGGRDRPITKQDLYEAGLAGKENSAEKRCVIQKKLNLPEHLSANALLEVLNLLYSRGEFLAFLSTDEEIRNEIS